MMRITWSVRHLTVPLLALLLPRVVLGVAGAGLLLRVVLGRPPLRPLDLGLAGLLGSRAD